MNPTMSFIEHLDVPFRFKQRPSPLPGELRATWGIALLLLIVFHSRGKKTSLQRLHVLNWAVRSETNRTEFRSALDSQSTSFNFVPRVEPSLNRAIQFAAAENLVLVDQGRNLVLTKRGLSAAEEINRGAAFFLERSFLEAVKSASTEKKIEQLLNWSVLL
jgi:hypothetical protein